MLSDRALETVDQLVAGHGTTDHPSLLAWSAGDLSRDELRAFGSQFFHLVDALPRAVSRTHAATADARLRAPLVTMLTSFEGQSPTSADLWLQTCAALGLFSDSVRRATPSPGASRCLETIERLTAEGPASGLAALYALLRQLPLVSRLQRDGLTAHYGMHGGPGMAFFDTFAYCSQQHAATVRDLLGRAIQSDADGRTAQRAVQEVLEGLDALLADALAPDAQAV